MATMMIQVFRLSQLSSEQLLEILRARVNVFVVEQQCPYPEIDDIDHHAQHVCLYQAGKLAAYARVYQQPDGMHIGRVLSRQRRQGLARQLLKYCLSQLCTGQRVQISAQQYLQGFYRQLGFEAQGNPYLEDGIAHIAMQRDYQP